MAFDLVQYFVEQIETQKPELLIEYTKEERRKYISEIIALTLGLAIFDLAKTILEQEVLFKSYSKNEKTEYKVLTKFLITIIIALLIEALLVVFKIAINDYNQMLSALYLIIGVGVIILSLSIFIFITKNK